MLQPPVITRFAPSPTGHLHIGGARSALFCWAYARKKGGHFTLRIEDTDQARSSDDSATGIMEDLAWLGINWDEGPELKAPAGTVGGDPRHVGPFFQARRVDLYNQHITRLIEEGKAYPAFETNEVLDAARKVAVAAKQTYRYDRNALKEMPTVPERLARMKTGEPFVVRFHAPHEEVVVRDEVLGDVKYAAGEMDDFVIRKADGFPTYHFAVVVDDETMGVTHVMRAQEHLNNTPRHVALQKALGFRTPIYAHMPLIFNMDSTKMSKRDKAKVARATLQAKMKADPALTAASLAAMLGLDAALVSGFVAKENDSLDLAEKIAHHFGVALPEIEVADFRANGYTPEAITNFLSLLGWNPGLKTADGKDLEKFDMKFLAENFSIERIGKTNAKFDRVKLASFNGDVLAAMPDAEFGSRWRAWAVEFDAGFAARLDSMAGGRGWTLLAKVIKARSKTFRDASKAASFVMLDSGAITFDGAAVEKNLRANGGAGSAMLGEFRGVLAAVEPFDPDPIHHAMEVFAKSKGLLNDKGAVNVGPIASAVRVAVNGTPVTPPLGETLAVLGKAEAMMRIDALLRFIG